MVEVVEMTALVQLDEVQVRLGRSALGKVDVATQAALLLVTLKRYTYPLSTRRLEQALKVALLKQVRSLFMGIQAKHFGKVWQFSKAWTGTEVNVVEPYLCRNLSAQEGIRTTHVWSEVVAVHLHHGCPLLGVLKNTP